MLVFTVSASYGHPHVYLDCLSVVCLPEVSQFDLFVITGCNSC